MQFFPRAYYLLGWNNEQFAVYYGAEYEPAVQTIGCIGGGTANITSDGPRTVLMWNAEYNTYGNGSNINLTYKYSSDGTWKKYYNINDRLGNVRTVLRKDGTAGTVVKQFFYTPFGSVIPLLGNVNRTKFIGKEKDKESNYADHGVRKYDDEIGRFTSIDPLWEKYYSLTPYQYAGNNPVIAKDAEGEAIDVVLDVGFIAYDLYDIGKSIINGKQVTSTQVGALLADVAGAMIPGVTGAGLAVKAASKADDAAKLAQKAEHTIEGLKSIRNFSESQKLSLKIASDAQMLEKGTAIAGAGAKSGDPIKDIKRIIQEYGGNAKNWSKKSSSAYKKDGVNVQTHWYENTITGERVEFKTTIEPVKIK